MEQVFYFILSLLIYLLIFGISHFVSSILQWRDLGFIIRIIGVIPAFLISFYILDFLYEQFPVLDFFLNNKNIPDNFAEECGLVLVPEDEELFFDCP